MVEYVWSNTRAFVSGGIFFVGNFLVEQYFLANIFWLIFSCQSFFLSNMFLGPIFFVEKFKANNFRSNVCDRTFLIEYIFYRMFLVYFEYFVVIYFLVESLLSEICFYCNIFCRTFLVEHSMIEYLWLLFIVEYFYGSIFFVEYVFGRIFFVRDFLFDIYC